MLMLAYLALLHFKDLVGSPPQIEGKTLHHQKDYSL